MVKIMKKMIFILVTAGIILFGFAYFRPIKGLQSLISGNNSEVYTGSHK
jgi:hypothetical protein